LFMVGLLVGKAVTWGGQARDAYGVSMRTAFTGVWPQALFGLLVCGVTFWMAPAMFWWTLPLTGGDLLAIPFTSLTASPTLSRLCSAWGLCASPDDLHPADEVLALKIIP
jgi:membrane glycosyltransferase